MPRATLALVQGVIEVDDDLIPDEAAMLPFITLANELVTEVCTGTAGPTVAYSTERLELIETWLAAHFYTNLDPRAVSESAGVSASYQSRVDLGFDTSHYGQTAMRMDTNGGLARLNQEAKNGKRRIKVTWLGTATDAGDAT